MKREEREEFVGKMTARIDARMLSRTPNTVVRNKKQRRRKSATASTHMAQNPTKQTNAAHKFITLLQRPPASDMNVALAWRDHIAKKKDENQRIMGENYQSEARLRNAPRRRQKQRTTVIPPSMRKKNRPQSSPSRLSMEARDRSSRIATLIDTTSTRIQNMKGMQ